jgi:phosphate transport system protein
VRMRFFEQLDELRGLLVVCAASVTSAIRWANESMSTGDVEIAARVLTVADEVRESRTRAQEMIEQLLVRQQPVASDLRLALAGLHLASDLERMGALAAHIAKIVVLRHPLWMVPPEAAPSLHRMGEIAERLAWTVARVLEVGDSEAAGRLDRDDDEMDILHRDMFAVLFSDWPHGVKVAVDMALIGRFYERYADHAVSAGQQVVYLVTGQTPTG